MSVAVSIIVLAHNCAIPDVAAVLYAFKMDAYDGVVGVFLRLFYVVAERRDAEHAATRADDLAALFSGSGMEDVNVFAVIR